MAVTKRESKRFHSGLTVRRLKKLFESPELRRERAGFNAARRLRHQSYGVLESELVRLHQASVKAQELLRLLSKAARSLDSVAEQEVLGQMASLGDFTALAERVRTEIFRTNLLTIERLSQRESEALSAENYSALTEDELEYRVALMSGEGVARRLVNESSSLLADCTRYLGSSGRRVLLKRARAEGARSHAEHET